MSKTTRELYEQYVIPTYGRFDLKLARGQGCEVWDEDGKRYLDFGAGIAVTSVGHCHPRVVRAMQEQIGKLVHTSNLYYTRPQAELAERLVRLVGRPGKVFFCNSGAEANEALYKLARKFGNETAAPAPAATARGQASNAAIDFVLLDGLQISREMIQLLPGDTARRHRAMPIRKNERGALVVAVDDPLNFDALEAVQSSVEGEVEFVSTAAESLTAALERFYGGAPAAGPARIGIITMLGSFHGRTLAGISATGQDKVKKGFAPMVEGFHHVPFNDEDALREAAARPGMAAILLEPIQGEIGVQPAKPEFLRLARALCDEHGLLLFFDEVQCGLGRTGEWCGWRALEPDVWPDAVSWAKGIAGGFPLGAIWVNDRKITLTDGTTKLLCDLLGPGSHGTTFGGTPLVCAGASEVLATIEEEGMLENARRVGAYGLEKLRALGSPLIQEVRGVGLMLGLELVPDFAGRTILPESKTPSLWLVERLHEAGLLAIPSGTHALRWLPPLNVRPAHLDEAAAILRATLLAVAR